MADFTIIHMYPNLLNLYGDRGNLICLQKRLAWYGYDCKIKSIGLNEPVDFAHSDMIFLGGGSDREQGLVYQDLVGHADKFFGHIQDGLPVLCICGAYQLLGTSYIASDGQEMKGLGFFNFLSRGARKRLIGNVWIKANIEGREIDVVGFENHAGRTCFEDPALRPFGQVIKGYGNNGEDKQEGILYRNLIGTYLHGPLLPKNPSIADFFIRKMAQRRGISIQLGLDDEIENMAHAQVRNMLK